MGKTQNYFHRFHGKNGLHFKSRPDISKGLPEMILYNFFRSLEYDIQDHLNEFINDLVSNEDISLIYRAFNYGFKCGQEVEAFYHNLVNDQKEENSVQSVKGL